MNFFFKIERLVIKPTIVFSLAISISIALGVGGTIYELIVYISDGPNLIISSWTRPTVSDNWFSGEIAIENKGKRRPSNVKITYFPIVENGQGLTACYSIQEYNDSYLAGNTSWLAWTPEFSLASSKPRWIVTKIEYEDSGLFSFIGNFFVKPEFNRYIFSSIESGHSNIESDPKNLKKIDNSVNEAPECQDKK